jgi:hypothetical protein
VRIANFSPSAAKKKFQAMTYGWTGHARVLLLLLRSTQGDQMFFLQKIAQGVAQSVFCSILLHHFVVINFPLESFRYMFMYFKQEQPFALWLSKACLRTQVSESESESERELCGSLYRFYLYEKFCLFYKTSLLAARARKQCGICQCT